MAHARTYRVRALALAFVAVAGLLGAGCGADDDGSSAGTTTTSTPSGGGGGVDAGSGSVDQSGEKPTADWPMFGHDLANTRFNPVEDTLSADDVDRLAERWKVTGAAVTSTPAVVDGVVYVGDWDGNLQAYEADTGKAVWTSHLQDGMLTPSPAVTDDTVYIAGDKGMVFAADRRTGKKKWGTDIESTPFDRIWSSPVVVDDLVIIGSASYQVFVKGSPPFQGSVVGLDAKTGKERWRAKVCTGSCAGLSVWSSAAVDTDLEMAFIGTGQAYNKPADPKSDSLIAIDYTTGEIVWHQQYTKDDSYTLATNAGPDFDIGAAPNLFEADGRKLVGAGDKGGSYRAFDRETGKVAWVRPLVAGTVLGGVEETTAYADGVIYAIGNTQVAGGRSIAVPIKATAFAIDAATGKIKWRTDLDSGGFGGVSIANGLMLFTTHEGNLRIMRAEDGKLLRSIMLGDGSASGPVVSDGTVYVGFGWDWVSQARGGLTALHVPGAAAAGDDRG